MAQLKVFDCSSASQLVDVQPALTLQWYNLTSAKTISLQSIAAGTSYTTLTIAPYSNLPGQNYSLQLLATAAISAGNTITFTDVFNYSTSVTPLITYIQGGSRTVTFSEATILTGVA
jgi:hypothetical protein